MPLIFLAAAMGFIMLGLLVAVCAGGLSVWQAGLAVLALHLLFLGCVIRATFTQRGGHHGA